MEGDGEAGAEGKGSAHGSVSEQDEACSSNVCPDPLPSEEKHRYYEQIELDVTRSATHLGLSRDEISTLRRRLSSTLHALFRENTQFHYYQGFHDLASIILHAFDDVEMSKQVIFRVMKLFLKEAMGEDLSIANDALSLLVHLIERDDRVLAQTLCKDGVGPQFALSWLLTWFSHDVRNAHQAFRLFDSFLSSHPLLPLYTAAAIIKFRKTSGRSPTGRHHCASVQVVHQVSSITSCRCARPPARDALVPISLMAVPPAGAEQEGDEEEARAGGGEAGDLGHVAGDVCRPLQEKHSWRR
uniref:Rab-GAP TBC domain-containing protein n=1 Tax=Guillardia theta TaxID=55529 RepID=A0A7S4HBR3_GUITH